MKPVCEFNRENVQLIYVRLLEYILREYSHR